MLSDYKEMFGFGNMLRSAEMEFVNIQMAEHLAHDAVEKLGSLAAVQFMDMNGELSSFKRYYTPFIRRCDDLEKKLKFFEDECKRAGVEAEAVSQGEFTVWKQTQQDSINASHRGLTLLDFWEAIINERHRDYTAVKTERDRTAAALYNAVQRRFVIEKAAEFFDVSIADVPASARSAGASLASGTGLVGFTSGGRAAASSAAARDEDGGSGGGEMAFRHIAGILSAEDKDRFERIVFRATMGHAVVRFADLPCELVDPSGAAAAKSVFVIFFRGRALAPKLDRICTAFSAHQHEVPNFARPAEVSAALEETKAAISDGIAWLAQERATSGTALAHLGLVLRKWKLGVAREKAVLHTLNLFSRIPERGAVAAQGWVLKTAVGQVSDALKAVHVAAAQGGRLQPYLFEVSHASTPALPSTPPTHFAVNKFTKVYQGIVNTYGVPRYREANPALFTIVTFPFLFGVMFGDMGHATILALVAAWMIWKEEAIAAGGVGEIFGMAFKGRYMLLPMGLFSIYCGAVYNDVFSLGATLFKSAWHFPTLPDGSHAKEAVWSKQPEDIYPLGIDPAWHGSDNDLLFFNSLKMKMSVVLGITQMIFGLLLKLSNAIYFGARVDLWLEVVPQLIFMVGLFGYMIFLIILKWSIDWTGPSSPGAPPSLIDTLINIALKPGTVNDPMFKGQDSFQVILLLIVFLCVPVMLVGKPYILHKQAQAAAAASKDEEKHGLLSGAAANATTAAGTITVSVSPSAAAAGTGVAGSSSSVSSGHVGGSGSKDVHLRLQEDHDEDAHAGHGNAAADGHGNGNGHDAHSFGELFIHQAIESIEFVLGSVSNTASYLRLWALSLAHSQLATVFWERALVATIGMDSTLFVFIGYAVFACITLGVLLLMDVLECFLHALRLHWVEFQNKFYKADGHKFAPFDFAAVAEALEAGAGKSE